MDTDIVIIGAGPYGLSLAAHLHAAGRPVRIFGRPMQTWRDHMPPGMMLKSNGFASTLADPAGECTLEAFCARNELPYEAVDLPVPLETFTRHGLDFQKRLVPFLETVDVAMMEREGDAFRIELANGERLRARHVICCTGIAHFHWVPQVFRSLCGCYLSHTAQLGNPARMRGKRVAVIGGGSSAVDTAVALSNAGARVRIITRQAALRFHDRPTGEKRTLWQRISRPMTELGPGWRSYAVCRAPQMFRWLPRAMRVTIVERHLGPAPTWFVREHVEDRIPVLTSASVVSVKQTSGRVDMVLQEQGRATTELEVDHVVCGTGYRVELARLPFLSPELLGQIARKAGNPVLSGDFESSVKGLYFTGLASAHTFGPLVRFACGAGFTARRITRRLARV